MRLLASIAVLCLASPAALAEPATTTPPSSGPVAAKPEKKICRAAVGTGTIMARRVCHTRAEWAQIDGQGSASAQQQLDERDRGLTGPGGRAPGEL